MELMAWIVITASLSLAGIFLNFAALSVTFWRGKAESIFNILMSHFVAINFAICLVNIPIHVFMVLAKHHGYKLQSYICGPIQFFFALGCAVCNWADVCLSVNRFVAIVFPHYYKWWTSKWVNLAMVALGWAVCTAAILPLAFGQAGSMPILAMGQCGFLPIGKSGALVTAVVSYIPYGIIASASLAIWFRILQLQRANNRIRTGDAMKRTVISRRRLVVARMLLMTTVWSAICNIPWGVIQFNFPYLYGTEPVSTLWLRTVQAIQYGFSPLVLYSTNEDYRRRFRMLLNRAFGRRIPVGGINTVSGTEQGARSSHFNSATMKAELD
ncbi:hypothetical protein BV898_13242 [Hypsibius exemplaris]|uniref:G-protein coupled receptors family 1 profile domain-containing protein n=1 Tax=Hypsibius exemplaris TaxID=2072580 RepID=A0A1W0WBC1_HYPEX|nr:hypothetical protein BV898_13242 [Hypsibius exemplaris]